MTDSNAVAPLPVDARVAEVVRLGLTARPKHLQPWLFYDEQGSRLFEAITGLPEYYLTRTERSILTEHAGEMLAKAAQDARLRIVELGAGSADKTRLLLAAAVKQQGTVLYEPVDVSASALEAARVRIEGEIPEVRVVPIQMDYTHGLDLDPVDAGERRLVLYIGSSIGNFEPLQAHELLRQVRAGLNRGDSLLLGVDLIKSEEILLAAYDDPSGVTAAFNRNILTRLNRELGGDFEAEAFAHRALWNAAASRIEMHLVSLKPQHARLGELGLDVEFETGESIHTENSYKYASGQTEELLAQAGFVPSGSWTDEREWFAVYLGWAD